MFFIIGAIVVLSAVIGGYLLEHGNLSLLYQPVELLIIGGAALGSFLISNPLKIIKATVGSLLGIFSDSSYSKADYIDALMLLNGVFYKIRQQGLVSIESDVDDPEKSSLFNKYPKILKNHRAIHLITDTLRIVMTTTIAAHELEALIDTELETYHEEISIAIQGDHLCGRCPSCTRYCCRSFGDRAHNGKNERASRSFRAEHRCGNGRNISRCVVELWICRPDWDKSCAWCRREDELLKCSESRFDLFSWWISTESGRRIRSTGHSGECPTLFR